MITPEPLFRSMLESDLEEVLRIEREVYTNPWPTVAFESCYAEDSYVVCLDDTIAGFVCCSVVLDECSIMNIAVARDFQGKGYGKYLLDRTINLMVSQGVQHIFLDVRVSNSPARKLYNRSGFIQIGIRKGYYSKPDEDAIVMALDCAKMH